MFTSTHITKILMITGGGHPPIVPGNYQSWTRRALSFYFRLRNQFSTLIRVVGMARVSALCLLVAFSGNAVATEVINECSKEIYVAYARKVNWGSDGLGDSGSVSQIHSIGWFRIGPYQRAESPAGFSHIVVMLDGHIITSTNRNDNQPVMHACLHPVDAFDRKVTIYDNEGQQPASRHPVSESFFPPGQVIIEGYATAWRWHPFQELQQNTFTIFQGACHQNHTPVPLRTVFKIAGGDGTLAEKYVVWKDETTWVLVSPTHRDDAEEPSFQFQSENDEWVYLTEPISGREYRLGLNHSEILVNGQWQHLDNGHWIK